MSPIKQIFGRLFRSQIYLGITPHEISLVTKNGNTTSSVVRHPVEQFDGTWQATLATLQRLWQYPELSDKNADLHISLPGHWCHMTTLTWSDAMLVPAQAARFITMQQVARYGDSAQDWVTTIDNAPYGRDRLACGVERELVHALKDSAKANGHRCVRIEPSIALAWRATLRHLGVAIARKTRVFAFVERGRWSLAIMDGTHMVAVQTQACTLAWVEDLERAWLRCRLRLPELADVEQVALVNLSGIAPTGAIPNIFFPVMLSQHELLPTYATVAALA